MASGVINELGLNFGQLNYGAVPAAAATAPDTTSVRGRPYALEVRSQAGTWLANVTQWRAGKRTAKANQFDTLSLEIPGDDAAASLMAFPNEVWLYLGDYDTVVQKFTVVATEERRQAGWWVTVEAESLMGQLSRELVTTYSTPVTTDTNGDPVYETQTVKNIVGELLALHQTQTPAVALGKIDASVGDVEVSIRFDNKSILACLNELHHFAGGYFYVDTSRKLQWRRSTGYSAGHWIKFGHNLTMIEVRTDYRALQTRLLGFGAGGTPETRLQSEADDSTAQSSYGVIRSAYYLDTVNEQDTLDEVTQAELERRSTPKKTYRVGVVNLAAVDPSRYNFEAGMLYVGTRVGLYVDQPSVALDSTVLAITWDLDRPAQVSVELSDPNAIPTGVSTDDGSHSTGEKSLFDYIADALAEDDKGAGIPLAIARSMDPPTENIEDILTNDNYGDRIATDLADPYGVDPSVDDFADAMLQRLIDALGDSVHPKNAALRAQIAGGTSNIWVGYTGS